MDFAVITIVSAVVAAVTLVSGFGLGTVLLPAFAVFFPIEVAIAATGVVHFANNLFKLGLVARWADRGVVVRFGLPAVGAAIIGAALMTLLASAEPLHTYRVGALTAKITWLKLSTAVLLAGLAALELSPRYRATAFPARLLPLGGVLSGFAGGVSGMQGALRAPFLMKSGLTKEQYVGTTNVISTIVDAARLAAYAAGFVWLAKTRDFAVLSEPRTLLLVGAACIAGAAGAYAGLRWLKKLSLGAVRTIVSVLLFVSALALGAGLV